MKYRPQKYGTLWYTFTKELWKITMFDGKTHYVYGHVQ
jgi:hypothetical protein